MILLDYSAIAIASIFSQDRPDELQEPLLRHMVLNSIRRYNLMFRKEYGQMIIACDNRSWRKDVYEHYKAKRATTRDESPLDWETFFGYINKIRDEIRENFPYPVIHVQGAEADDIIGALARSTLEFGQNEKVMIVSSDKDFIQLHKFNSIKQYSPMGRKEVKVDDPTYYLFEHICKGDTGDGVPNILSEDRTFVDNLRQSPMRKSKMADWFKAYLKGDLEASMPSEVYRNFCRNKQLIDLTYTPQRIVDETMNQYNSQINKKSNVLNYLIQNRCAMLVEAAGDFLNGK